MTQPSRRDRRGQGAGEESGLLRDARAPRRPRDAGGGDPRRPAEGGDRVRVQPVPDATHPTGVSPPTSPDRSMPCVVRPANADGPGRQRLLLALLRTLLTAAGLLVLYLVLPL